MSVGSLLCMPVCANLANRYGSKRLSGTGYLLAAVFVLLPVMPNQWTLFPVCMLYGMSASLFDIAINGNSILVELSYKKAILSAFHGTYYVGTCVGALVAIGLMWAGTPTWLHFGLTSMLVVAELSIVRPFLLRERPKKEQKSQRFKLLFPTGILLLIAFIALFSRVIEGVVSSWSTTYMKQVVSLPESMAPVGLAVYATFMAAGRFCGDVVRKRLEEPFIILLSAATTCVGIGVMICSTTLSLSIAGLLITGVGMSCFVPVIYSLAGNQKGVSPGTGIAMVNTISGTGFLFGPFMIGLIAEWKGVRGSFFYVLILATLMLCLSTVMWRRTGRQTFK